MLAAANRLRDRRAIANVQRRGWYTHEDAVTVKAARNQLAVSRAVVVVSKKVSKKAVVRNRIRRRLAGILADRWATVAPGYDIVITVRDNLADTAATDLTRQLTQALQRAKLTVVPHPTTKS